MIYALLPLIAWVVTAFAVRRLLDVAPIRSLLLASVIWGVYLVLVTEVLSLFAALRLAPLVASWALPVLVLLWVLRRRMPKKIERPALSRVQIGLLAIVALYVAVTGLVACVSAPNTWDSMTYHLPRVMHWSQNGSVAHYATHEPRQLYMSPWAEMAATHFQILSGGDRLASLIQWFSMAGSLLAASLLAGRLGASGDGRAFTVLAAATIPMGLLQAVSTQTDYVVSFHILCVVYFLTDEPDRRMGVLAAAAGTGLAVLTKATAYLFLAPFLAVFAWRQLRTRHWRTLLIFGAVVLAINLGHYGRNLSLFGSPLLPIGLGEYHDYANETFGAAVTASNAARSVAAHFTPPGLAARSHQAIRAFHRFLGLGPDDPRTTWPGMRFEPPPARVHEDFSGNFWHGILVFAAAAAIGFSRRLRSQMPRLALHAALVTTGFVLFAAYLKWTPWHARLHLPLFLLSMPVVGCILARLYRPLALAVAVVLVAQSGPYVLQNPLHPLRGETSILSTSRDQQYLSQRPHLAAFTRDAAERLAAAGCAEIGLSMPPDTWEYPWWIVLRQVSPGSVRVESLARDNLSRRLLDPAFEPCAVVCIRCSRDRRGGYAARFGEPILTAVDDLPYSDENMAFLE